MQILMGTSEGTWWCGWLRHCTRGWKVMGLLSDGVGGIFCLFNPSSCIMALGWTKPLTKMITTDISRGVKAAGEWG